MNKRLLILYLAIIVFIGSSIELAWIAGASPTTYYIDYTAGNDSNNGTSTGTPWKTCTNIQPANFLADDDTVNIKVDSHFVGADAHCKISSTGSFGHPIVIQEYGETTVDLVNDATVQWADASGGNVTPTRITSDKIEGAAAVNLAVNATFTTGNVAYHNISSTDLSGKSGIQFYIKSDVDVASGELQFLLDDSNNVASPLETINIPALKSGIWIHVQIYFATPSNLTAVTSVGIKRTANKGIQNIKLDRIYGGLDPLFDGSVPSTDAVSTWDVFDAVNHVYVSHESVSFNVDGIVLDGTSSVARMWNALSGQNSPSSVKNFTARMYQGKSLPAQIYLKLSDGSDPNTHTIRLNRYGPYSNRGIVSTDDTIGAFIDFHHFKVMGSTWMGFSSSGQYVRVYDSEAFANAREGFYHLKNATNNGTGSLHNYCSYCLADWNNVQGSQGTSAGQGMTIESQYVDYTDVWSHDNWMTGIDLLNYNTSTNAANFTCTRCVAGDNSHRSQSTADFDGFDPAGFYGDGGHDYIIRDSRFYKSSSFTTGNAILTVNFGSERPSTFPVHDAWIINTVVEGNNYQNFAVSQINCSGSACNTAYGIHVIGCTFYGQNGTGSFGFGQMKTGGAGIYSYDNQLINNSGGKVTFSEPTAATFHSDYNQYYSQSNQMTNSGESFATWKTNTGQDAHSIFAAPSFVSNQFPYYLKNTAAGDASTSSAVDAGIALSDANVLSTLFSPVSDGYTRSDGVADTGTRDIGYHSGILNGIAPTVWWLLTGGGTDTECTGLVDAAYPGSGTAQPCAFKSFYYLMKYNTDPSTLAGTQHLQGGDIVIAGNPGINPTSFKIGYDRSAPQSGASASSPYDVHLAPLPSGPDPNHPTSIIGRQAFGGCGVKTELWGTQSVQSILDVSDATNVRLECLDITDHSGCAFRVGGNQCSESYPSDVGDYGRYGIYLRGVTNLYVKNTDLHGLADRGALGAGTNITWDHVNMDGNGMGGWDWDDTSRGGTGALAGNIGASYLKVRFTGCPEAYPRTTTSGQPDTSNYSGCTDQNQSGYGDGWGGTGPTTTVSFSMDHVEFSHNVQDGLDLLYFKGSTTLKVDKGDFEGNVGNQLKFTAGIVDVTNSILIANSSYLTDTGKAYNVGVVCQPNGGGFAAGHACSSNGQCLSNVCTDSQCQDTCFSHPRANGTPVSATPTLGHVWRFINDAFVSDNETNGSAAIEVNERLGTANGTETYISSNNIYVSPNATWTLYYNGLSGAAATALSNWATNHSIIFGFQGNPCPSGTGNLCATDPKFASSIVATADSNTAAVQLQSISPAISAGITTNTYWNNSNDYADIARGSRNDIGAYNYQGCLLTANGGACSSSTTCCGGFCCSSVCASSACSSGGTGNGGACSVNGDCTSSHCCSNICAASCPSGGSVSRRFTGTIQIKNLMSIK